MTKNDEQNSLYDEILQNEKFASKVLISTSVLDNGVNFKDQDLKHIVVSSYDKTMLLQMLGRKRLESDKDTINLYIHAKTASMISGKRNLLSSKLNAINMFERQKNDFFDVYYNQGIDQYKIVQGLFYFAKEQCCYNHLGKKKIERDIAFLSDLTERVKSDPDAYIREQLSWLGLEETFNEQNKLNYQDRQDKCEKFKDFLQQNVNTLLVETKQNEFATRFKDLYRAIYGARKNEKSNRPCYGLKTINDIFKEIKLPYALISRSENKKTVWELQLTGDVESE